MAALLKILVGTTESVTSLLKRAGILEHFTQEKDAAKAAAAAEKAAK
jgi:hypothetical protein